MENPCGDSESESLNLSGHMQKPAKLDNPEQWRTDVRLKVETPVAKEQAIFQVRATRAVQHLLATLDSSVLVEVASAPTDTGSVAVCPSATERTDFSFETGPARARCGSAQSPAALFDVAS